MNPSVFSWMTPTLAALLLYGMGQGLVKKYIGEVSPARFCLYFVVAKSVVNLGFFFSQPHPSVFDPQGLSFLFFGVMAYILDGTAWIFYFQSIIAGPITIVGTLSAAYPALTVVFARILLSETLLPIQYFGVAMVILGCIGLSYGPMDSSSSPEKEKSAKSKQWVLYAVFALLLWGLAQTIVKYSYQLPQASEVNLALFNTIGGILTLGIYGGIYSWFFDQTKRSSHWDWLKSLMPMGMMAGGDLSVIIATRNGPISVVTPLSGAYPVVTLIFARIILKERISCSQMFCVGMILTGMVLSPGSS